MIKVFLALCAFSICSFAAEPPADPGTMASPKGDIVANPSGKLDDTADPNSIIGWQKGYKQSLKLQMKDLNVTADFPLNSRHAFQVSGFDNLDNPYEVEVKTTKKNDKAFQVEYSVRRGQKKESGTMVIEKGKLGKMEKGTNDILDPVVVFETKITN